MTFPNYDCPPKPYWVATRSYSKSCPVAEAFPAGWIATVAGILHTVSGLAVLHDFGTVVKLIAVHDNISPDRVSILEFENGAFVSSQPVEWIGAQPTDLEAIFIYGGTYFAMASSGRLFRLSLAADESSVSVVAQVDLPSLISGGNYEGADIGDVGGQPIFMWASRGSAGTPSVVGWYSNFNPITLVGTGSVRTKQFTTPFPTSNVRHVSALRIGPSGTIYVTSASDPGNDGPFTSAFYSLGIAYRQEDGGVLLSIEAKEIYRSLGHKAEAIARLPSATKGFILGADDENFGGAVYFSGDPNRVVVATRQGCSYHSEADAINRAMAAAKAEVEAELLCRFVARACGAPVCVPSSSAYSFANDPICRSAVSRLSQEHAEQLAMLELNRAQAAFCLTGVDVEPELAG